MRGQARWPFRPLEIIQAAQDRRVRQIIRHAYQTVPYYRRTLDRLNLRPCDFRTAADLARLPLISPAELRAEPEQFFSKTYASEACLRLLSSGTTGQLRATFYPAEAILQNAAHGERERAAFLPLIGQRYGYRETVIAAPVSADHILQAMIRAYTWVPPGIPIRRQYLSVFDSTQKNSIADKSSSLTLSAAWVPTLPLFAYLAEHQCDFHQPDIVTYSSEVLPAPIRRIIERNFNKGVSA